MAIMNIEIDKFEQISREIMTESINDIIKNGVNKNNISDGYHTFGELYEHRYALWFKLCEIMCRYGKVIGEPEGIIKAKRNNDGSVYDGYFLLGYIDPESRKQLSYHLPMTFWDKAYFANEFDIFPNFDGHTSADVLERIKNL